MEWLRPCPFCGNHWIDGVETDKYGIYVCVCNKCKASGPRSITVDAAEKAWNRRANDEHD